MLCCPKKGLFQHIYIYIVEIKLSTEMFSESTIKIHHVQTYRIRIFHYHALFENIYHLGMTIIIDKIDIVVRAL